MKSYHLLIFFFINSYFSYAQTDFNNYVTIKSKGEVNQLLFQDPSKRIKREMELNDRSIKNTIDRRVFVTENVYRTQDLFNSGNCVFGDEISEHGQKIVNALLKQNDTTKNKFEVITYKHYKPFCFITYNGLICYSTGLISNLENDAQLAFVLAMEIAHFENKKAEDFLRNVLFDKNTSSCMYIPNYPFDEDCDVYEKAVSFYKNAGFSLSELNRVYKVLNYSYLPFDEFEVNLSCFESPKSKLPSLLLNEASLKPIPEFNKEEDNNQYYDRHKKLISVIVNENLNAEGEIFVSEKNEFERIKDFACFESVRSMVLTKNFAKALYSILILEKKYPNSMFLKHLKAQTWLGIYQYKKNDRLNEILIPTKEAVGQSGEINYFLKALDLRNLAFLSLRIINDLHQENPLDIELNSINNLMLKECALDEKIDLKHNIKLYVARQDSSYIKRSSSESNNIQKSVSDSLFANFYLSQLEGISRDSISLHYIDSILEKEKIKKIENQNPIEENEELQVVEKSNLILPGLSDFTLLDPRINAQNGSSDDYIRDKILEGLFKESLLIATNELSVKTGFVKRDETEVLTLEQYNRNCILATYENQYTSLEDSVNFPVDYTELHSMLAKDKKMKLMSINYTRVYNPDYNYALFVFSALFPPIIPYTILGHLPSKYLDSGNSYVTFSMTDFETGELLLNQIVYINFPINLNNLASFFYNNFSPNK